MAQVDLPETFTLADVRAAGISVTQFYRLRDQGMYEAIRRGIYRRTGAPWEADIDLVEIAAIAPMATLCLTTALARHGLTDEIAAMIDVALPRNSWKPITATPVAWHSFALATFEVGREQVEIADGLVIGVYNAPRSIIDAFRLRHREGSDLGIIALRRWLRRPGSHPADLVAMATLFPKATHALRTALEVLGV